MLESPLEKVSPLAAQLPMTVRLQLLAARFAELLGQDPDTVIVGSWADHQLWTIGLPDSATG